MTISNLTINRIQSHSIIKNQQGFTLVLTMVFLVILSLVGVTAIRSSRTDVQIAGNERWAIDSFYRSESGAGITTRILEDISRGKVGGMKSPTKDFSYGETLLTDIDFDLDSKNNGKLSGKKNPDWGTESSLTAHIFWPKDNLKTRSAPYTIKHPPLTQILVGKKNRKPIGESVETGRGKDSSSSPGGAYFDIWSRNRGQSNAETVLHIRWLHID